MFCVNCVSKIDSNAKFCASCGAAAPIVPAPPPVPPAIVPEAAAAAHPSTAAPEPAVTPPPPPSSTSKTPKWIPITTAVFVLVVIVGIILIITNLTGANGDDYVASGGDETDIITDGEQLAADELPPVIATEPPRIEHGAGELRKGDIPQEEDTSDEVPRGQVEHDNDWVAFNVTSFEYFGGVGNNVIMHYEITNIYNYGIQFREIDVLINDDEADVWIFQSDIAAESSIQNNTIFWERGYLLTLGDTLTIRATVYVFDNDAQGRFMFEELGHVEFTFTVNDIVEPGSNVTNPEHISGHEDISLLITDVDLREETEWSDSRAEIEFVMINPTEHEVAFDEAEVFINGVRLSEDDFFGLFFRANPGYAARNTLSIRGVHMELGDTVTIRGRFRVAYSIADVTQETVEFTFVL